MNGNNNPYDDGDVHVIPDPDKGYVPEDRERWERDHPKPSDETLLFEQEFDLLQQQRRLRP